MEPYEYKPKASAKVRTRYHIVLVTKYRKRALEGIEKDALDSIRVAERRSRFTIHRINTGDGNHVHMLVSIPPDMTISGTVSRIKQLTTHELWAKHSTHLKNYYWGKHHKLWSAGYYCETVGRNSESIVERYIDNQKQTKAIHPRH
ncbi:IS200/IS605 family transposase [Bifidobacterium adolescentis]|uniref:IS200/IS605 family transposase n=1 Tax=Bifidobacterium adolescentis TaxID=1680 RepID=UPI0040638F18